MFQRDIRVEEYQTETIERDEILHPNSDGSVERVQGHGEGDTTSDEKVQKYLKG